MIAYLRAIKNFKVAEKDGDSVAETNLPGILTCNGLIFVGKEHTTKSTKIYTPRKFLRVRYRTGMHMHYYVSLSDESLLM